VSGGVDSTVCAALLREALGRAQVRALHIDHGFMRGGGVTEGESARVVRALEALDVDVTFVNAAQEFAEAVGGGGDEDAVPLREVVGAEAKRRIIGDTFMCAYF
jgi:GMP synthase (glutamine-hydrolysing)